MSIAVLISTENQDEHGEALLRRKLQMITYSFLLVYTALYLLMYYVQSILFNEPNNNLALGFYITLNLLKLSICTILGVTTIILARRLKEIHSLLQQELGNTTP